MYDSSPEGLILFRNDASTMSDARSDPQGTLRSTWRRQSLQQSMWHTSHRNPAPRRKTPTKSFEQTAQRVGAQYVWARSKCGFTSAVAACAVRCEEAMVLLDAAIENSSLWNDDVSTVINCNSFTSQKDAGSPTVLDGSVLCPALVWIVRSPPPSFASVVIVGAFGFGTCWDPFQSLSSLPVFLASALVSMYRLFPGGGGGIVADCGSFVLVVESVDSVDSDVVDIGGDDDDLAAAVAALCATNSTGPESETLGSKRAWTRMKGSSLWLW
mmetsp:Transcript_30967/g.72959  ORF Transcript_30967/g.72959 Transcript_30967/m.72959 type:complete len:270 (+) Transcript_30967:235-1044(+)